MAKNSWMRPSLSHFHRLPNANKNPTLLGINGERTHLKGKHRTREVHLMIFACWNLKYCRNSLLIAESSLTLFSLYSSAALPSSSTLLSSLFLFSIILVFGNLTLLLAYSRAPLYLSLPLLLFLQLRKAKTNDKYVKEIYEVRKGKGI